MHQRIIIWRSDGIVENIEVDQSYFMAEVNHVDRHNFDRNLGNITPCRPADFAFDPSDATYYSLHLHPTYGF